MKNAFIVFLFLASATALAQDSLLIGYWKLQKIQVNDQLIFDSNDTSVLQKSIYRQEFKNKNLVTKSDSLRADKKSRSIFPVMAMTFIEFKAEGKLRYGFLNETPNGYEHKVYEGYYETDGPKFRIVLSEDGTVVQTITGHFTVNGDVLKIMEQSWENSYNSFVRVK